MEKIKNWDYKISDFEDGTGPYEEICSIADDFLRRKAERRLAEYAKAVGFNDFAETLADYKKSIGFGKKGGKTQQDNVTDFTGQALPLCCGDWTANDTGVTRADRAGNEIVACSHPVTIAERWTNIETGEEKVLLSYRKGRSKWKEKLVRRSTLASAQRVVPELSDFISIDTERAKNFVSYISTLEDENISVIPERKSVSHLGYVPGEGFVPYCNEIYFDGDESYQKLLGSIREEGDFETWIKLAGKCRENIVVRIILDAALVSPLLAVVGSLPFIVHMYGESGGGKTVALKLASSVWGDPDEYYMQVNSTAVSLETRCGFLNHLPLVADETQTRRDGHGGVNLDIYKLTEGRGKERSDPRLGRQKVQEWRNTILTAGESRIVTENSAGGEYNRVLQIPVEGDLFPQELAADVLDLTKENFGGAGRRLVEKVFGDGAYKNAVRESFRKLRGDVRDAIETSGKQTLMLTAILLGDFIASTMFFHDTPLCPDDLARFAVSKDEVSVGQRGYDYLLGWISQNANRFIPEGEASVQGEVYGKVETGETYIIRTVFNHALRDEGFDPKMVLAWMRDHGKITGNGGRARKMKWIQGRSVECVCLVNQSEEFGKEIGNVFIP